MGLNYLGSKLIFIAAIIIAIQLGGVVVGQTTSRAVEGSDVLKACGDCTTSQDCVDCLGPSGLCLTAVKNCYCDPITSIHNERGKKCLPLAVAIGDDCEVHGQCTTNIGFLSQCNSTTNKCECKPGALGNTEGGDPNTKCLAGGVHIQDKCMERAQCVGAPGTSSTCSKEGLCVCLEAHIPNVGLDDCLPIQNELGGPCSESQQCVNGVPGPLSECSPEGKCNCTSAGIPSGNGDHCYRRANLVGDECEVGGQCWSNLRLSYCVNGTCECYPQAVICSGGSKCLLKRDLGGECQDDAQCEHIEHAVCCGTGLCECNSGYSRNPSPGKENTCMKMAAVIGDPCNEHESQCNKFLVNSTCLNDRCGCSSETRISGDRTKCLSKTSLEGECEDDWQCEDTSHASCKSEATPSIKQTCKCDPGYTKNPTHGKENTCMKLAKSIGDPCDEHDSQCDKKLRNATCRGEAGRRTCVCTRPEDLIIGSTCFSKVMSLNETCFFSGQCLVANTRCYSPSFPGAKRCLCDYTSHVAGVNNPNKCFPYRTKFGEECKEINQCGRILLDHITCHDNLCQCEPPMQYINNRCVFPRHLNEACTSNDECVMGVNNLTECVVILVSSLNGKILCKCNIYSAVEMENTCWERKRVGYSCNSTKECTAGIRGPVHCSSSTGTTTTGTCVCDYGQMSSSMCLNIDETTEKPNKSASIDVDINALFMALILLMLNSHL